MISYKNIHTAIYSQINNYMLLRGFHCIVITRYFWYGLLNKTTNWDEFVLVIGECIQALYLNLKHDI